MANQRSQDINGKQKHEGGEAEDEEKNNIKNRRA